MRLLYGTYNPAKLDSMRRWLSPLEGLTLVGLMELDTRPADAEETGETPLENARMKARAYCEATGMITLAADSGLYLDGIPNARQPGVHARRVDHVRLDDDGMIAHYTSLAREAGGRMVARYRNGLCIAFPDGRTAERFDDTVASAPFFLVDTPHARRTEGFPLDSISVDIQSGEYYFDLGTGRADDDLVQGKGYRDFVCEALGLRA